jgi:hypothetical protein
MDKLSRHLENEKHKHVINEGLALIKNMKGLPTEYEINQIKTILDENTLKSVMADVLERCINMFFDF